MMQASIEKSPTPADSESRVAHSPPTPLDATLEGSGYHAQRGSGALATARPLVPEATRTRRAVAIGGGESAKSRSGARKRLAASALSPDPKVSADSDTARLQEMVLASLPKELTDIKAHAVMLQEHSEAIRILRGTAMEQENRLRATLTKLNLTVAATNKLDDAVEMVEADQAAISSDFQELKQEVQAMRLIFETKEIEQDAKLVRLVEQRHIDVHALSQELEAKMAVVEATFVKVEGLMFQLETQAPAAAAASSSSVLPSTGGPEFILLKSRVERMGREIAELNGGLCGAQQAVADAELRVNDLVMQTAMQSAQTTAALVAEREQLLCHQIQSAIIEVGKGACQCPPGCTGQAGGPPQLPPGVGASGAGGYQTSDATSQSRAPFLGAGGRFNAPGGRGGDGPGGGGGGGGGRPGMPAQHDIFSDDGHHKLKKSSKSPFDSKAARDELPRFNGKDKPELWRKKVTYYLHSKNANMQNLLRWAELQTEEITSQRLADAINHADSLAMLSDDPETLSYHLWGFLNVNLTDSAWDLFDSVSIENGLEVWRVVNLEITQKTQSELLALEDQVLTPHRVHEIRDIDRALVAWDAALRNYIEAGGTSLSKHRQVGAIMRLIPIKVRDQALWEFDKFDGRPEVLRKWVKERTQWFTKADVARPGGGRAHLLDGELAAAMDEMTEEETAAMEEMSDGELCAFVRKKFLPGQRRGPPRTAPPRDARDSPPRTAPPRDARDITCPNCLTKGHTAKDCKAAKVMSKDRLCFECGEPGHIASRCPNKGRAKPLSSMTEPPADGPKRVWLGCVADSAEIPVHRKRMIPMSKAMAPRPEPRGCTLGDCMGGVFAQLAELERAEAAVAASEDAKRTETEEICPNELEDSSDEEEQVNDAPPSPEEDESDGDVSLECLSRGRAPVPERPEAFFERCRTCEWVGQARTGRCPNCQGRCQTLAKSLPDQRLSTAASQSGAALSHDGSSGGGLPGQRLSTAASQPGESPSDGSGGRSRVPTDEAARPKPRGARRARPMCVEAFSGAAEKCADKCCHEACGGTEAAPAPTAPPADGAARLQQRWAARRREIQLSKEKPEATTPLVPSWRGDAPVAHAELNNFWGVEVVEELNALGEPEFIEIEMTLDTGATCHAADRVDFPGCLVLESPGSKAGQHFQCAGNKLIPNEGQANISLMMGEVEMAMTMQIAKISRPLLSVTQMTKSGEISVLCRKEEALVLDSKGNTVATFHRKGGLYIAMMKYRNPKFKPEADFARPHE